MRMPRIGRFGKLDDRGGIAVLAAICAPVLLLITGFGIDYGYAAYLNQRLAQATDNAVLGSVSQSAATAGGGFDNTAWLQAYGQQVFNANISNLPISGVTFNLQVTSNGKGGVDSVGSYNYNYPTFFAGLIGMSSMPLTSQIRASANPVTYINYYVVVDVSQSMGIGATPTDMQALFDRVVAYGNTSGGERGCVFGCHVLAPEQAGHPYTNEQLAHNISPRISLRIDAAVSAIQNIISDAQSAAGTNKNIKIGLYTINRDPTKSGVYVTTVSSPSADYTTLGSQAATIDLGNNISAGAGDSDFNNELSSFVNILPANGSGASAVSPKNYVFLVTDGLSDASIGCTNCHPTAAFASSLCDPIKSKATMGVIYTTYNAIYNNNDSKQGFENNYNNLVVPYATQIAPNLQSCASGSSFYFEASDGPAINSAMRSLFATTLQNARLTQ